MLFEFSAEVTDDIETAEKANIPIRFYNLKDSCYQGIHSCEGDMITICNAMADYADLLKEFLSQSDYVGCSRAFYEIHAERCRKISQRLQEQIGYDRNAAIERCRDKRNRQEPDSDIGEEAMVLAIKKARQQKAVKEKEKGDYNE